MSKEERVFLLVEDNADNVVLTKRVFQKHNLRTQLEVVCNGQQALDFLLGPSEQGAKNHLPILVLLDLEMPIMNGIETLKRIKHHKKIKQIPVVVLTTSQNPKDISTCYALGANGYIEKPTNFEDLARTLLMVEDYWSNINVAPQAGL